MKKIIKSLLLVSTTLIIGGCGKVSIDEERTIILEIDSSVNPNFSSNVGQGTYDNSTKIYTHKISSIKDLYITLSYDNLKSLTVHIPTSEMTQSTIKKEVEFGQVLDAEVEITIEGVKTLEGLTMKSNNTSNLTIGDKNSFKVSLPSREQDYDINFSLPGYRDFNIKIEKEDLISGFTAIKTVALTADQIYIGLNGSNYQYTIYSLSTNNMISSGHRYQDDTEIEYLLLNSNDEYYAKVEDYYTGITSLHKLSKGQNIILSGSSLKRKIVGYLNLTTNGSPYDRSFYLYDKQNHVFSSSEIINSISNMGLLIRVDNNEWYYIEEINITNDSNDHWNYDYEIDFNLAIPIDFNVTRIHRFTSNIISSGVETDFYPGENSQKVILDGNTFNVTIYENETSQMNIDVYTKDNVFIDTITTTIQPNFNGIILENTISYQGKRVPYTIPLFVEDIEYNNGSYTYTKKPMIDTDVALVEVIYVTDQGEVPSLSSAAYIIDDESNTILSTTLDNKIYFELKENETYTLYDDNRTFVFTLTPSDVSRGQVIIFDGNISFAKFKIHKGYSLSIQGLNIDFSPDSDDIVSIPIFENEPSVNLCLSNGLATACFSQEIVANTTIELDAFYVLEFGYFENGDDSSYEIYNAYSNNYIFTYLKPLTEIENIYTSIAHYTNNVHSQLTLSKDDFVYNSNLNAYYYSPSENSDYILSGDIWRLDISEYIYYSQKYYLKDTAIVRYNEVTYDLANYNSKYLTVTVDEGVQFTPDAQ